MQQQRHDILTKMAAWSIQAPVNPHNVMAEHASAPLSKIDGERDVMAEIKCEFQFAFSGNSQASSTQPGANSEVSKKSRFQNPFSYLKQSASSSSKEVLSDGGAPATPVDPPSSSSSSGSNSRSKPDYKLPGRLMMTSYRMQFYYHPSMSEGEADAAAFQSLLRRFRTLRRVHEYCTVALGTILRVEKSEKYHSLEVETKDHRKFHLSFHGQPEILLKVHELLVSYAFPSSFEYVFAFCHRLPRSMAILDTTYAAEKSADECLPLQTDWDVYSPHAEWRRQGLLDNLKWRISNVNQGYGIVPSYPSQLVVPASIPDEVLVDAAGFRSIARIPCITWVHPGHGASLSRASQPKIGMSNAFSVSDEDLVAAIANANPNNQTIHIVDCRPMSSAMANRAKGYGVESSLRYKQAVVEFMNIPNIHTMRDSAKKLKHLSLSLTCDNLNWYADVEDTKWLYYVRVCLKATLQIVDLIHLQKASVLVHCSHGWDRTSQLCALAQLCLDPFYRTIQGFQVLIEKDFLSFGHPFQIRLANGAKHTGDYSPIFLQFLDCVWQLQQQYPTYFEFNQGLLCLLADELYSCRFGTFLLSSQQDREAMLLRDKTTSIWTFLNGYRSVLLSRTFVGEQVLLPTQSSLLRGVSIWPHVFLRWSAQASAVDAPCANSQIFVDNELRHPSWRLSHSILSLLSELNPSKQ
ncbi:hypothetical protein H310_02916 [Aphanomyces invadans]|uniref:Myotubularin phosphatase domain-containing protein n=1 Tax=Aphanomyces invadans TaxID=157072 RepID=A0A024UKC3_9STRA|nr:hypothetical protein H310_02916 [Aphanomyces invadans]ETW06754.1 hypothetical protein H310_02916 [Aphanomyces invadans]|eukprot:XP_008864829.1 hypothetical protein H310_02916 [Aphanomyces invadans]